MVLKVFHIIFWRDIIIHLNKKWFSKFKIYKNQLTLFINEPLKINELPLFGTFDLEYDLGSFLMKTAKLSNYFIARDREGKSLKFFFKFNQITI